MVHRKLVGNRVWHTDIIENNLKALPGIKELVIWALVSLSPSLQRLTCTEGRQQGHNVLLGHCGGGRGGAGHGGSVDDYRGTLGHNYQHQTRLQEIK